MRLMLVVSEETGALSLAYDSKLYYDLSSEEILERLHILFSEQNLRREGNEVANEP